MEEPAPRMFWPREIWGRYADELAAFKEPSHRKAAVRCLNHMVSLAKKSHSASTAQTNQG